MEIGLNTKFKACFKEAPASQCAAKCVVFTTTLVICVSATCCLCKVCYCIMLFVQSLLLQRVVCAKCVTETCCLCKVCYWNMLFVQSVFVQHTAW